MPLCQPTGPSFLQASTPCCPSSLMTSGWRPTPLQAVCVVCSRALLCTRVYVRVCEHGSLSLCMCALCVHVFLIVYHGTYVSVCCVCFASMCMHLCFCVCFYGLMSLLLCVCISVSVCRYMWACVCVCVSVHVCVSASFPILWTPTLWPQDARHGPASAQWPGSKEERQGWPASQARTWAGAARCRVLQDLACGIWPRGGEPRTGS